MRASPLNTRQPGPHTKAVHFVRGRVSHAYGPGKQQHRLRKGWPLRSSSNKWARGDRRLIYRDSQLAKFIWRQCFQATDIERSLGQTRLQCPSGLSHASSGMRFLLNFHAVTAEGDRAVFPRLCQIVTSAVCVFGRSHCSVAKDDGSSVARCV